MTNLVSLVCCGVVLLFAGGHVPAEEIDVAGSDLAKQERIVARRIRHIADAIEISEKHEALVMKQSVPLLKHLEETRKLGGVDPLDWIVLQDGDRLLLVSRKMFAVQSNFSTSVNAPICKSHLQNRGISEFVPYTSIDKDPVLESGRGLFSKVSFRVLSTISIDHMRTGAPRVDVFIGRANCLGLSGGSFTIRNADPPD